MLLTKRSKIVLLVLVCFALNNYSYSQCTNFATFGSNQGTLTIDGNAGAYQTVAVTSQYYYSFSVTCGNVYYFDFCGNGGSSGSLWPVITVLDPSLNIISTSPYAGGCSVTSFTSSYTGTAVVYMTDDWDGCTGSPAWSATLAYNETGQTLSYTSISCNSATAVLNGIPGGTYSFNPVPGDAAVINSSTGAISNGTPGATYNVDYLDPTCGSTVSGSVTLTAANASFTLSANGCSGATATITGTSGGTFSFNPAPGDAAVINASTGEITNGTPGATYYVDYSICGTTTNQSATLSAGDASFSLAVACGGATATITGDAGGTFSFNPNPGDGAQVNASSGGVSNGNAGTTYFVQYTVCGTSTTESVTVLTDDCWTLNGDAQYITVGGESCIQLTDELNNQTGCSWNGAQIDFGSNFSLSLDYYFGNNIGGADGNTFTFQPSASTACGSPGGQLGAGGLTNALSIEFDTYDNDSPMHVYDMLCDHIAIETDGNHQNGVPAAGPVCAKSGGGNIDDGGLYEVEITWNATTNTLEVYFNGFLRLTYINDIVTNVFGGQSLVYWGATSATGGLNNQQYFCPSTVVILPIELSRFESFCNGEGEVFEWTTESENNTDYFVLEYTYDGMAFFPLQYVDAAGNSETAINYSVRTDETDSKTRYYRIKSVDTDGSIQTSGIIASKNCANTFSLIKSVHDEDAIITIFFNEEAQVSLVNTMGQEIKQVETKGQVCQLNKSSLSKGVYYIYVVSESGRKESRKIVVQ